MSKLILVTTTSDNREELESIASTLVEKRLAACCQISGPVESWYRWEGKTESSQEWSCAIKSIKPNFSAICRLIERNHHYDVPQIVCFNITDANDAYAKWIHDSVDPA